MEMMKLRSCMPTCETTLHFACFWETLVSLPPPSSSSAGWRSSSPASLFFFCLSISFQMHSFLVFSGLLPSSSAKSRISIPSPRSKTLPHLLVCRQSGANWGGAAHSALERARATFQAPKWTSLPSVSCLFVQDQFFQLKGAIRNSRRQSNSRKITHISVESLRPQLQVQALVKAVF